MSDKTWKKTERRVAAYWHTERVALSGGNSKITRSDTMHKRLFVETKYRKKHSAVTLWDKTRALAKLESKTPVVALVEKGRPGFWVLVHSDDLVEVAEVAEDRGAIRPQCS